MKKRILSFVLAFLMAMTMMPMNVVKAAEESSYPFTSITCANGKYNLMGNIEEGDTINNAKTYNVAVPVGTSSVDITFPEGETFQNQWSMSYQTDGSGTGYDGPSLNVKTNADNTVTITLPIGEYTDSGKGILLYNSSFINNYGFDFTVKDIDFPVESVNLEDSLYVNDNFIKQIKIDGASIRDYQLGDLLKEGNGSNRVVDIYLADDTADDAAITVNYITENSNDISITNNGAAVSDKKSEVTLVNGEAKLELVTKGRYGYHPHRYITINISKKTANQVEEYNKQVAADVDTMIEEIGEVVYTQDCKDKIAKARKTYDLLSRAQKKLVKKYDDLEIKEEELELLKVLRIDLEYDLRGGQPLGAPTIVSEGAKLRGSSKVYWYLRDENWNDAEGIGDTAQFDTNYLLEIYIDPTDGLEFAKGQYVTFTYNGRELDYLPSRGDDAFWENGAGMVAHIRIHVPKAEMYSVIDLEDATFENGTKVSQMGLPETLTFEVEGGNLDLPVTWDIDELPYDFTSTKEQSFTIYGTVAKEDIPSYVEYNEEISLTRAFNVTVKAADAQNKADEATTKIDALKEVTLDSKEDIEAARKAYDALSDEQKALVEGYDKLVLAESLYSALEKQAAADASAKAEVEKANTELANLKAAFAMTTKQTTVTVKAESTKNIVATWTAVENADNYKVEILRNGKVVETVNTKELTYTYTGGKAGYAYTVVVTPTITYDNNVYEGIEKEETVITTPTKPSISVKKSGSKFKVTAKKRVCTGYQIQVSKKKNFKSGVKKYTMKKTTLSKSIKLSTLKKGTNYVRVRAYKTYNGKTVYSKWSKVKTVKK